jgi:hypothetical protein
MSISASLPALLLLASLVAPVDGQERAPWFGMWVRDERPRASRFETPQYKKVTTRIEPWDGGLRVVYDMVRARGGITHLEWTGRFDGNDYPVQGVDYVLTNAYRPIDDSSYEIVIKVDGKPVATAVAVVSPDRATLTVTTTERDARGQMTKTTAVYRRQ